MTRRTWLVVIATGLLAGCQTEPRINNTPHPGGGGFTKPGVFSIAVDTAPWVFAAMVLALLAGALIHARRPRRGRYRAAG